MFSSKKKFIVLVDSQSLSVFVGGRVSPKHLLFSPLVVSHLEVLQEQSIREQSKEFFHQFEKIKRVVTILLTPKVVFSKVLPKNASPDEQRSFFDMVPLHPDYVVRKTIIFQQNMYLMATNAKLYLYLVELFTELKWEIEAVYPLRIIPKLDVELASNEEIFRIYKVDRAIRTTANLLVSANPLQKEK